MAVGLGQGRCVASCALSRRYPGFALVGAIEALQEVEGDAMGRPLGGTAHLFLVGGERGIEHVAGDLRRDAPAIHQIGEHGYFALPAGAVGASQGCGRGEAVAGLLCIGGDMPVCTWLPKRGSSAIALRGRCSAVSRENDRPMLARGQSLLTG